MNKKLVKEVKEQIRRAIAQLEFVISDHCTKEDKKQMFIFLKSLVVLAGQIKKIKGE